MKLNELIQQLLEKLNIELYEVAYGIHWPLRKSPNKDYFIKLDDAIKFAREKSLIYIFNWQDSPQRKPHIHRYKLENGVDGSWSSEHFNPLDLKLLFTVKYVEKIDYKHPKFDKLQEEATVS